MDRFESFWTLVRSNRARLRGRSGNELLRPWTQCVPSPEIRKARPQVSQKTRLECRSTTKCISLVLTLSLSLTSFVPQIPAELSCSCGIQDTCLFRILVSNAVASIGNWVLRGVLVVQDGTSVCGAVAKLGLALLSFSLWGLWSSVSKSTFLSWDGQLTVTEFTVHQPFTIAAVVGTIVLLPRGCLRADSTARVASVGRPNLTLVGIECCHRQTVKHVDEIFGRIPGFTSDRMPLSPCQVLPCCPWRAQPLP